MGGNDAYAILRKAFGTYDKRKHRAAVLCNEVLASRFYSPDIGFIQLSETFPREKIGHKVSSEEIARGAVHPVEQP